MISVKWSVLPSYTAQTLLRMVSAYGLSLFIAILYAYTAYRSKLAAVVLIPLLDILQSIPVLSFLPGIVLALIALFPGQRIGLEIAAILLISTGMTWNMVFSFYQSLLSLPRELKEASQTYRLKAWQRFWTVELPAGAIGLVWNSVMSMAGGWFFLMAIESFTLGQQSFQLPGLGSFLAVAANQGNMLAILVGVGVLITVIIAIDFLVWQPLIAWAERFKFESVEAERIPQSPVLDFLRRSPTLRLLSERLWGSLWEGIDQLAIHLTPHSVSPSREQPNRGQRWRNGLVLGGGLVLLIWGSSEALQLLRLLNGQDWQRIALGSLWTAGRVLLALVLSLLWTVPVGVAIGRHPPLAQFLQPLVQIAASVPATALFPVLLLGLVNHSGGLQLGSVALMMLGTMWYLLFNVIAGAQSIPSELFEAAEVYRLPPLERWRTLILPGIFPYLMTGVITAVGGAWNASIVSEYVQFQGQILQADGLGEIISQATETGNFPLLLAATVVMASLVVLTNRLVWHPLYRLAQEKYQLLI
ncbi:MAG: ABC transporter permease subunit [Cyanobacteriota bacterium]|nr:ABC transporter permease subunit [Cyanobacteriota bacterium]